VSAVKPTSFDHVALWTDERDAIAEFTYEHFGMHEIERTDDFTLVGVDAKLGKLTLFDADGPREPGALERIALRVRNLPDGEQHIDAPGGLRMALVEDPAGTDFDLHHVVLRVADPERSAAELEELGFERRNGVLAVGDRELHLVPGGEPEGERPLLNHLALLVDSAEESRAEAERRGVEIADWKDAANTLAVFVWGPDRVKLEYVEHKPGFALV
jgi:catechol 2,3-dioxygenase-like lactoylglutathione lyase family enzyme